MDGTPPIFLTEEQKKEGSETMLIFSLSFSLFIILFFLTAFIKPTTFFSRTSPTELQKKRIREKNTAERFVDNFHMLSIALVQPGLLRIMTSPGKAMSWIFLLFWVSSIIVLQIGLNSIQSVRDDGLILTGLIMYFIGLIGYFIARVLSYFKDKLEIRKKVNIRRRSVGDLSTTNDTIHSNSSSAESNSFDENFNYKRRIKHLAPVYNKIDINGFNFIQTIVVLTEFIQLASFPLRDLFRSMSFINSMLLPQGKSSRAVMNWLRSVGALFSTGLPSIDFDYVKFIICFWITIIAFGIALIMTSTHYLLKLDYICNIIPHNHRKLVSKFISGRWILATLPLINLFYLVILNSFLERLGCLSSNSTPTWPTALDELIQAQARRISECLPIYSYYPSTHTWYSLAGFTLAFILFTTCRTAQEPKPEDGTINYTSSSELILKSASIVILLLYTLVPTPETTTLRGCIAAIILSMMTLYNLVIGSTYSRWINFARTISFLGILWMSLVITYYTHPNNTGVLFEAGSEVWIVIFVGWMIIWVCYSILYYFVVMRWEDKSDSDSESRNEINDSLSEQRYADNNENINDNNSETSEVLCSSSFVSRSSFIAESMSAISDSNSRTSRVMGPRTNSAILVSENMHMIPVDNLLNSDISSSSVSNSPRRVRGPRPMSFINSRDSINRNVTAPRQHGTLGRIVLSPKSSEFDIPTEIRIVEKQDD